MLHACCTYVARVARGLHNTCMRDMCSRSVCIPCVSHRGNTRVAFTFHVSCTVHGIYVDDLCRKIKSYFLSFSKGFRIIRGVRCRILRRTMVSAYVSSTLQWNPSTEDTFTEDKLFSHSIHDCWLQVQY